MAMTPEQQRAIAMAAARKRATEAAKTEAPSTVADMAKSGLSGLARGTMDLAGLPGTISDTLDSVLGYGLKKGYETVTGQQPEPGTFFGGPKPEYRHMMSSPLSADKLHGYASDLTGGATEYKAKTTPGKYMSTVAEFLPSAAAFGGVSPGNLARFGVAPGLASEAAGQATEGSSMEPYARIAAALAAPAAIGAAERIISPFQIPESRKQMVDALRNEGVDLTAGQQTGSNTLRYMESELGGMAGQRAMETQGEQFTRAALSRAGINADRATPEVMDHAFTRIGRQFDDLAARNSIVPDTELGQSLGTTLRDYQQVVAESQRSPIVGDVVADIAAQATRGPIGGDFYQSTTSRLARVARSTKDPELRGALLDIRGALDDAMERSLQAGNPADLGAWQEVRSQYRNMLVLEKAATGAGENAASGLISPSQLRNAAVQQSKRAYVRGEGDFAGLARAGEAVMKPLPQSGTAPRAAVRGAFSTMGGIAGALAGGGVPSGVAGALAGAAVPPLVGRALLSGPGRAYLTNQLIPGARAFDPRLSAVAAALIGQRREQQ